MTPHIPLLYDFVVLLGAATAVILISSRLRIPTLVGFLITGLIIGPSGLRLISDVEQVEVLAEFGVVALLFVIGLEFSLERLKQIRRAFFLGGSLQAALTISVTVAVAMAFGYGLSQAVFFGFLITLSSTALVLRIFGERQELDSPHGSLVLGILLFQDFLVVPMIILTPVLAGTVAASPLAVLTRFGGGILLTAIIFVVARHLMPYILHMIVRTRSREVFVVGAIFICLGMALLTETFELSLALGAFIAGIIISESEYSHQIVADILPFRDVFISIFFISIGMLLSLEFVVTHLGAVLLFALSLMFVKVLITAGIALFMRYPTRTAALTGFGLAQIGEFSFVVANIGMSGGLVSPDIYQTFLAGAVLSMMATPLVIQLSPRIIRVAEQWLPVRSRELEISDPEKLRDHVIVVGYGLAGEHVSRVLSRTGIRYIIIELSGEAVDLARGNDEPVIFGDAARREILELARIEDANVLVVAISDPEATRSIIVNARALNRDVELIARTRLVKEIDSLYALGADLVIAEEFETSIEIFTRVLERYHVPRNVIQAQRRVLRAEGYEVFREGEREVSQAVLDILAEGATDIYRVVAPAYCPGKTLAELALRQRTGVSVIAVVREDVSHPAPDGDFRLQEGDFIVLHGGHAQVERAFRYLEHGE
jgi:monovalent cation:H+ antiporter-2, CPA2 family